MSPYEPNFKIFTFQHDKGTLTMIDNDLMTGDFTLAKVSYSDVKTTTPEFRVGLQSLEQLFEDLKYMIREERNFLIFESTYKEFKMEINLKSYGLYNVKVYFNDRLEYESSCNAGAFYPMQCELRKYLINFSLKDLLLH
ncbi:hypothetical protein [Priestia megaterium]|uniref:hypothetical protein n=1 Tax=Priestia megaterium TaxID=1404 RepID=UPI002453511B|nr:hypothetical protein [Priestia megaterium]MDH3183671.1 hypothetical protein [Priestia megaterium]